MRIFYCGKQACEKNYSFGPAVRTHYLIHFVLDGKGTLTTEYGIFELHGGEAFLIRPDEKTFYRADSICPWSYAWMAFDGEEAASLLARYYPDLKRPVCMIGDLAAATGFFEQLLKFFGNADENHEKVLGYFYLILSCLIQTGTGGAVISEESLCKKAVFFIRHNYCYSIQISDVADYVGIDRTYLYRIFIHQLGMSPKQYINHFRLSEAKGMLYNTEYKITEIAYSCGYHDSSSFCRHFRRELGMSPAEYRKMRKSKNFHKQ